MAAVLYDDFTFVKWLIQKASAYNLRIYELCSKVWKFWNDKIPRRTKKLTYDYISDGHLQLACERRSFEIIEYIVQVKNIKRPWRRIINDNY